MKPNLILFLWLLIPALQAQEILTLPDAIQVSLKNNFSVRLQANAEAISKNNNTIGNAGMLPSLSWIGTQNNTVYTTHQKSFTGTEKNVTNALNTSLNTGVQLNWTLFDGLNMFVSRQMLDVLQRQDENTSRAVLENTVTGVAVSYYSIIQLKKLVKVRAEALELSLARLKIAKARFDLGSGSQLSVLQSIVDLNSDSSSWMQQVTSLNNARAELNYLLARDANTSYEIMDSIRLLELASYEDLVARAINQNSQLLSARMDEDIARLDLRTAEAARYPRLNLQSGYNFLRQKSQTGFAEYNQSFGPYFGLTASYTLFNGLNTHRTIRNARIMLNSSETAVQQVDLEVRTSLLKLYTTYQNALNLIRLQKVNIAVAEANETASFEKYKLGSLSDVDLRDVQKKLVEARYQLVLAEFEAKQAEIELIRISGDLLALFRE